MSFLLVFLNIASLALLLLLVFLAVQRREAEGAREFAVVIGFGVLWALGSFGEIAASSPGAKLFWRNLTQVGVFYIPAANLCFALAWSGQAKRARPRYTAALFGFQTLPLALILTDGLHHLMRSRTWIEAKAWGGSVVSVESTLLAKGFISINYVLQLAGLLILLYLAFRATAMRKQIILTTAGLAFPTLVAVMRTALGDAFLAGLPSSTSFVLGGSVIVAGFYGQGFLRLTPIARDRAFDVIDEGILVSSPEGILIDANPAALRMLSRHLGALPGQAKVETLGDYLLKEVAAPLARSHLPEGAQFSLPIPGLEDKRHYVLKSHDIIGPRDRILGHVGVLRDVTNETIQADILRSKAEKDSLTGIYNRAAFVELVEDCARRIPGSAWLMIFDIDGFKGINDSWGHLAGDEVLKGVCESGRAKLRDKDIFGRIGGDEFAIFLQGLDAEAALRLAERIRAGVAEHRISFEGQSLGVSISAGLAGMSLQDQASACLEGGPTEEAGTWASLFGRADEALYSAKAAGKNLVCLAEEPPRLGH